MLIERSARPTAIHNLDFWTKCVTFLFVLPICAFLARPLVLMGILILVCVVAMLSGLGIWQLVRSSFEPLVAISIAVGLVIFVFSTLPIDSKAIQWAEFTGRFFVVIALGVIYGFTTNPIEIPRGFHRAGIPHKYGITLMVAMRLVPEVGEKLGNVVDAMRARGVSYRFEPLHLKRYVTGIVGLLIPLIYVTLEAAVDLSDTVVSRGYNPTSRITLPPSRLGVTDVVVWIGGASLLLLSVIM